MYKNKILKLYSLYKIIELYTFINISLFSGENLGCFGTNKKKKKLIIPMLSTNTTFPLTILKVL